MVGGIVVVRGIHQDIQAYIKASIRIYSILRCMHVRVFMRGDVAIFFQFMELSDHFENGVERIGFGKINIKKYIR